MKTKLFALTSWFGFLVSAVEEWGLELDFPLTPALWLVIATVTFFATTTRAALTNNWINGSGKWETASNWSLGVTPSNNQSVVSITNATTKTVTIGADTALSNSVNGCMTFSNLLMSAPVGATNTLQLANAGLATPLRVINSVTISTGGSLQITNSLLRVDGLSVFIFSDDGNVVLNTGTIIATNATTYIGNNGTGQLTVSDGTWQTATVWLGFNAGSQGTLTVAGGTNLISSLFFIIANAANTTGAVWLTGGQLTTTNSGASIGSTGVGQMTVSNGTWLTAGVDVGSNIGSEGTLTIAGGTNTVIGTLRAGAGSNAATGTVWLTGGQLTVTNGSTLLHSSGAGQMIVSGGTWAARNIVLGDLATSSGTLTLTGGTSTIYSNVLIGNFPCTGTGVVVIAGGSLFVTNAAHTAVLDVRSGTVQLNTGTLAVDKLVVTNACGHFIHTGGTLLYNSLVLDPNLSAVGDGIPNGWKQQYGLDPFDPSLGSKDSDGDGLNNLQEYLAGTDPTNSASALHITSVVTAGNNVVVTWLTGLGKTNALQSTSGASYNTNFTDLVIITNTTTTITNATDVGGATNQPARFYRVRLVP